MQIKAYGQTDIGQKRERNEDAYLIDASNNLFIVCDGMGGHAAGDIASQTTAELVHTYLRDNSSTLQQAKAEPGGYFKLVELAEKAAIHASQRLYEMASSQTDLSGMGTTLTMLLVVDNKAVMSHIGDSRLYLLRDRQLHQLSTDHTLAHDFYQRGEFTQEQYEASPFNHILTRTVGSVEAAESEMLLFDVLPNDTFLLCSDGLTKHVKDLSELTHYLSQKDVSSVPDELVALANSRGGRDNITAVVARIVADSSNDDDEIRVKADALQSTFLCEDISYRRLIRLVEMSETRTYEPGQCVLQPNDPCDGLYLVVSGQLTVSKDGQERGRLTKGNMFCETALVRMRKARLAVHTIQETTLLLIPRANFQRLTWRFPKFGRVLNARLLEHFGKLLDEVSDSV